MLTQEQLSEKGGVGLLACSNPLSLSAARPVSRNLKLFFWAMSSVFCPILFTSVFAFNSILSAVQSNKSTSNAPHSHGLSNQWVQQSEHNGEEMPLNSRKPGPPLSQWRFLFYNNVKRVRLGVSSTSAKVAMSFGAVTGLALFTLFVVMLVCNPLGLTLIFQCVVSLSVAALSSGVFVGSWLSLRGCKKQEEIRLGGGDDQSPEAQRDDCVTGWSTDASNRPAPVFFDPCSTDNGQLCLEY